MKIIEASKYGMYFSITNVDHKIIPLLEGLPHQSNLVSTKYTYADILKQAEVWSYSTRLWGTGHN